MDAKISKLYVKLPEPSIWEDICRKEKKSSPFSKEEAPVTVDFDASATSPVFYGKLFGQVGNLDVDPFQEFDPAKSHPAAIGYSFIDAPPKKEEEEEKLDPIKSDPMTCPAKTFLHDFIFPILLPGFHEMLFQAKRERCFERKRTKFNACDFLTEWLYNRNPLHPERLESPRTILEIPFCKEFSMENPREALPLSLLLSDEQAATIIQSHYRGYLVRKEPDIAGLRSWQREWNDMNEDVRNKMSKFWRNQGIEGGSSASLESGEGEGEEGRGSAISIV